MEIVENALTISVYEAFPFTRIAILIIAVLLTRRYIRDHIAISEHKKSRRFAKYAKRTLLTIVFAILTIGALANIRGVSDTSSLETQKKSQEYLEANKENYVRCDNSLNSGKLTVSNIAINYQTYENFSKTLNLEKEFMKKITDQCQKPVDEYESTNSKFKLVSAKVATEERSLIDRIIGNKPANADNFTNYDRGRLISEYGFNSIVFTEEDVQNYFEGRL